MLKPGDPAREQIEVVLKAGERAANLTQQLLAFSRQQVLQPGPFDLNGVVENMRSILQHLMGDDVEVLIELYPGGVRVCADRHQLEQVTMNLALNARDVMPTGGRLLIETDVVQVTPGDPAAGNLVPGAYARLSVSDTGTGMDENTRQHMFEPFFTTKEVGKGTGLGLSMVQGVVEQSGGHIEVQSEPGRGTKIAIYLPVAPGGDPPEGDTPGPAERGPTYPPNRKRVVLVVEDQADVRDYVIEVLNSNGYGVLQAANAAEAKAVFRQANQRVHLVLTDVILADSNGVDLAAELTSLQPGTKVLFMSGYADKIADIGAHFIQKPFSPDLLAERVRVVLSE
jgi:CheY-like chemotaxis protein